MRERVREEDGKRERKWEIEWMKAREGVERNERDIQQAGQRETFIDIPYQEVLYLGLAINQV